MESASAASDTARAEALSQQELAAQTLFADRLDGDISEAFGSESGRIRQQRINETYEAGHGAQ